MKFLYYGMSELWGHRRKGRAGNEKTGASEVRAKLANPLSDLKALCGPKISREALKPAVKKSRYCAYHTRTVNRHRWMRRES